MKPRQGPLLAPSISFDGEANWSYANSKYHPFGFPASGWGAGTVDSIFDVPAGKTPHIAVYVKWAGGSNTPAEFICHLYAQAQSTMGAAPPY